jgi:hypothetical protein
VGKLAKGKTTKVRRFATVAGGRHAKVFVDTANRSLSYQADRRMPVFPRPVADFVICTIVIGAIVSIRNDFENPFGCISDLSQARHIAFGKILSATNCPSILGLRFTLSSAETSPPGFS